MMRLPVLSGPADFDYEKLNAMVDAFLDAGYTYFDTSFVYHNGKSEEATRKALVERHLRDSFTVATKFPTFNLVPEEEIDGIFQSQLDNLGVDYIDCYVRLGVSLFFGVGSIQMLSFSSSHNGITPTIRFICFYLHKNTDNSIVRPRCLYENMIYIMDAGASLMKK